MCNKILLFVFNLKWFFLPFELGHHFRTPSPKILLIHESIFFFFPDYEDSILINILRISGLLFWFSWLKHNRSFLYIML